MVGYINKVPYFKKNVYCSEITLKQYKIILKSLLADEFTEEFIINNNNLLKDVTSFSVNELTQLNFIEYLILIIFLRIRSSGSTIKLVITEGEDKKIRVSVDLKNTLDNLSTALQLTDKTISWNNLVFTLGIPTLTSIINNVDYPFIKTIQFKNDIFESSKDIKSIINTITPSSFKKIEEEFKQYKDVINKINFYTSKIEKYNIPFTPTSKNILFLLKLVYNDDLINIYNDMFYLSKNANLSTTYLDNCTPGEFKLHIKTLEQNQRAAEEVPSDISDLIP